MNAFVSIVNPKPGGSRYTSAKRAAEYVRRDRAEMDDGMLRFLDRIERTHRLQKDACYWNGSPKPFVMRDSSDGQEAGASMRLPGEVRS